MKNKLKFKGLNDAAPNNASARAPKARSSQPLRNPSSISSHSNPTPRRTDASADDALPEKATDFAGLANGSLIELIEDPKLSDRTLFVAFKNGRVRFVDRIVDRGQILIPMPRSAAGLADVRLPRGVASYQSVTSLVSSILVFISRVVDIPEHYLPVLATYVVYTWVSDRLPTAVYLSIIGLPQSGKSTLLALLNLLCRRPLLVNDISGAALYRACDKFGVTLLVDEIDWTSDHGTGGLRQLLRAGTNRNSRGVNLRQSASSFGPKVFCSLETSTDPALNSRCIEISMAETRNRRLLKPSDPRVLEYAATLQQQLLKFRLSHYKSIRPVIIPGAEELRPRSQDVLNSLAAPVARCPLWGPTLLAIFKQYHDPGTRESLAPRQAALVGGLFLLIHANPSIPSVDLKYLTETANVMLRRAGERGMLSYKATGVLLSALGLRNRQRTNHGWILSLDSDTVARIHQLAKSYDNEFISSAQVDGCSICGPMAATNSGVVHTEKRASPTGERREHREHLAGAVRDSSSTFDTVARRVAGG